MKKIAIIGLGYVGLPLYLLLNKLKFETYGFDVNKNKIELLNKNISYNSDILSSDLKKIRKKNFFSMDHIFQISKCDYIIICLPTPLIGKTPDMSFIIDAFNKMFKFLKKGHTIILESTVYPGATKDIFEKKLNTKFTIGKNFYLTYSPERIDPGKKDFTPYSEITKLISGYSKNCLKKIKFLYSKIFKNIYVCNTIEIAEFSKLFENAYRAVNIGLVNEIKILLNQMKLDMNEVVAAASTKPFGFTKFSPGPGMGGHCIPIDPVFISWIGKKYNFTTKFIDLSVKINRKVADWIFNKIYNYRFKSKKKSFLVLGLAYKKNINDSRESPAVYIIKKLLKNKNLKIDYFDPYIPEIKIGNKIIKSIINISAKILKGYSAVIIFTDHDNINYKKILKNSNIIFDTRGVYAGVNSPKIIKL